MEASGPIQELYGLPLDEFTAARNALARSLKDSGRADEADMVKKLRKPPVSAWAVNQLARDDPAGIERLLELVDVSWRRARRATSRRSERSGASWSRS